MTTLGRSRREAGATLSWVEAKGPTLEYLRPSAASRSSTLSQFDTVAAKLRQSLLPGCSTTRSCPSPTKGGQGVWGKANARGRSRRCARLSFAARQLKSVGELHLCSSGFPQALSPRIFLRLS
jgi:hypothetical protein